MCQGAYAPDVAADTIPEVTVAPAPAFAPPAQPEALVNTAPLIPPEAAPPAPAPTPAAYADTSGYAEPAPPVGVGSYAEPAPAPVGVGSYAEPAPTKRKVDASGGSPASKRTKTTTEEGHDSQALTTKWMESTVIKIKAELKKRGLDQTGRKVELVERLVAHLLS